MYFKQFVRMSVCDMCGHRLLTGTGGDALGKVVLIVDKLSHDITAVVLDRVRGGM